MTTSYRCGWIWMWTARQNDFEVDKLVSVEAPPTSQRPLWAMIPKTINYGRHSNAEKQHGAPGDVAVY